MQLSGLSKLLERLGDNRAQLLRHFDYELLNPHWSRSTHDHDSGVTAMHMMEIYNPGAAYSSPTAGLEEVF